MDVLFFLVPTNDEIVLPERVHFHNHYEQVEWQKANAFRRYTFCISPDKYSNQKPTTMKLGAFSMSLSVKDLAASKAFYENLGFSPFAGGMEKNYLIMKNGNALIGLFQGMFAGNILTFNPGWDENAQTMESFDDIREIQKALKSKGVKLESEADENTSGPASLFVKDPDGNMILLDQHV
jgi:catechol 2,3-dioxygenase-like lactoylglutathione lyase family enzyme